MSQKRRDNRNRVLNTGESQRTNGLYVFKYIDRDKKPKFVYSWRLVETDRLPAGKRPCKPLREKEREIRRDLEDGIDPIGKKMTVSQLYAKFTRCRLDVREGTERSRAQLKRLLFEDAIGSREIGGVKPSDAKEWAQRMKSKGFAYSTISNHKRSLKAAFYLAIADDCIRKNPFDFKLATVIKRDVTEREPLSREQVDALLGFMRSDAVYHRYIDEIVILLGTGLRISDADGKISLNQQKPSNHAGLRRFGPEKFLQRNNEFMKERPIFYKNPIKIEKDFSTWLRCFYYTTKAVITEYINF